MWAQICADIGKAVYTKLGACMGKGMWRKIFLDIGKCQNAKGKVHEAKYGLMQFRISKKNEKRRKTLLFSQK